MIIETDHISTGDDVPPFRSFTTGVFKSKAGAITAARKREKQHREDISVIIVLHVKGNYAINEHWIVGYYDL